MKQSCAGSIQKRKDGTSGGNLTRLTEGQLLFGGSPCAITFTERDHVLTPSL